MDITFQSAISGLRQPRSYRRRNVSKKRQQLSNPSVASSSTARNTGTATGIQRNLFGNGLDDFLGLDENADPHADQHADPHADVFLDATMLNLDLLRDSYLDDNRLSSSTIVPNFENDIDTTPPILETTYRRTEEEAMVTAADGDLSSFLNPSATTYEEFRAYRQQTDRQVASMRASMINNFTEINTLRRKLKELQKKIETSIPDLVTRPGHGQDSTVQLPARIPDVTSTSENAKSTPRAQDCLPDGAHDEPREIGEGGDKGPVERRDGPEFSASKEAVGEPSDENIKESAKPSCSTSLDDSASLGNESISPVMTVSLRSKRKAVNIMTPGPLPTTKQGKRTVRPGPKTVSFFARIVGSDEHTARRFLTMCRRLRTAITCYHFCPTFTPGVNCSTPWKRYDPGVTGGSKSDPSTCPCSLCGRSYIENRRVRVCGYNTERARKCTGSIYQFPKDIDIWKSLRPGAKWYCTGCWLHATAERERTPRCLQNGSVPLSVLQNHVYKMAKCKSLAWVEENLF